MGSAQCRTHFSVILPLMRSILFAICLLTAPVSGAAQQPKTEERIYPITAKGIKPPQTISMPSPDAPSDTPRDNRKVKFTHIAIITGYVGTDGLFHSAKIMQSTGYRALDARALDAIQAWRFHPCTKDGKAVNCSMTLQVEFHLYEEPKKSSTAPDQSNPSHAAKITS
jgi:TonB family protein